MKKIIMFHGRECPHCAAMHPVVEKLANEGFVFEKLEVWHDKKNADEMRKHSKLFKEVCDGELKVPTFFDEKANRAVCGEMSFSELKSWIQKK
jgi:glutaredoxin